jgi:O-phosphoseryl-tRNA synthetase
MKFDPNQIREAAREDFDKTWQEGREYLGRPSLNERYPRNIYSFGSVHPSSIPFRSYERPIFASASMRP